MNPCASCGSELTASSKFCPECGTPTAASRGPRPATKLSRAGERKQVTVLFADVKGSMDLAGSMDAEEWRDVMGELFDIACDAVLRFEGTIDKFTGDGIMALFGAPIAHEDHARRACLAALALRDALADAPYEVRIGLNSGEVVVGSIGDDMRMEYTALGHTVGLAQRMESVADPGTAYLTEATAKLVDGFFDAREAGLRTVKGVHEPVLVYELVGEGALRTSFDVARRRGLAPFVGRDRDIAVLEDSLARAASGRGGVVGVVGEPGIGKSRLCHEFIESCRANDVPVAQGRAVAHGATSPYLPVLELLRDLCGVRDDDEPATAREKIAEAGLGDPLVYDFLGVTDPANPPPEMDADGRQRELLQKIAGFLDGRHDRPLVLHFDDLHWIDGPSDAVVAHLADIAASTRTLVLTTFRPEYEAEWMKKAQSTVLTLRPLEHQYADALLVQLLGSRMSLVDALRDRTGGNPFFIEEVTRAIDESGADAATIPATVQAVLASRIDRLHDSDKMLLQTCAVIGSGLTVALLRKVTDTSDLEQRLDALVDAEFLVELSPDEFGFKHPLTREVAYGSQLARQRSVVHRTVASAIAGTDRDEDAAVVAHHLAEAGELLEAARWEVRAAKWAGILDATEAILHWRAVLSLAKGAPESPVRDDLVGDASAQILSYGWRLQLPSDEALDVFEEGRAIAERRGDTAALALLTSQYGAVRGQVFGDIGDYVRHVREAARLAASTGDLAARISVSVEHSYGLSAGGELDEALEATRLLEHIDLDDAEETTQQLGYAVAPALGFVRGLILTYMGRLTEADEALREALDAARRSGDPETNAWTLSTYVVLDRALGRVGPALEHAREAIDVTERTPPISRGWAWAQLGIAHLMAAEPADAVRAIEKSLVPGMFLREWEPAYMAYLARALADTRDVDRARTVAREAVSKARAIGAPMAECEALVSLAHAAGDQAEADEALRAASEIVVQRGARYWEPFIEAERSQARI